MRRHRWIASGLGVLVATTSQAATLRVPSVFRTIQAGIDASAAGDTVLVAPGLYSDYTTRGSTSSCVFLKDGVVLRSEGGSAVTTIHMVGAPGAPSLILGYPLPSTTTTVEGFSLTSAPVTDSPVWVFDLGKITFRDCILHDIVGEFTNGGLNVNNGDVDVIGCRFINCQTQGGGAGIYHHNGRIEVRDSYFENCEERAIFVVGDDTGSEAILENCQFVNCRGSGGGAVKINSRPGGTTIRGCLFQGNSDDYTGGGAAALDSFGVRLVENCVFSLNETTGLNGRGGALNFGTVSLCVVRGNTFFGNHQAVPGGGAAVRFSSPASAILENNIVAGCTGSAAIYKEGTNTVTSACNVFWQNDHGNAGGSYVMGPTDLTVDPMFCDPVTQNFTLMEGSPCLPENSQGCGQIGVYGLGCGPVSVDSHSWSQIKGAYRSATRP